MNSPAPRSNRLNRLAEELVSSLEAAPSDADAEGRNESDGHDQMPAAAPKEERPAKKGLSAFFHINREQGSGFRWSSLIETLLFLGGTLVFNALFHPQDPGYRSVHPHPFWIVVLLISIRYVFKESILSATIAAAAYSYFVIFPTDGIYNFSALSLFSDFKEPLLFLIVAGFVSGYTQHLLERTYVLRGQVRARNEEIAELRDRNLAAVQALRRLEGRIASEFTSILDLFAELAHTKQMTADQVKRGLLEVLVGYLRVEQAVYYDIERGQLRPRYAIGPDRDVTEVEQETFTPDRDRDFLLLGALETGEEIHLGQFTQQEDLDQYQGQSLLAGALRSAADAPIGLVSVERIPFIDYNPHTFKLFGTVLDWWSSILDEALRLEELRAQSIFNQEAGLFNYHYFSSRIAQEFERTKRFALPMSMALIRIDQFADVRPEKVGDLRLTLARIVNQVISELEMAALYKTDELMAISFPIAMVEDAEKRLQAIVAQIDAFDFHPYQDPEIPLKLTWAIADYEIGMDSHAELIARVEQQLEESADD